MKAYWKQILKHVIGKNTLNIYKENLYTEWIILPKNHFQAPSPPRISLTNAVHMAPLPPSHNHLRWSRTNEQRGSDWKMAISQWERGPA